jgi:hypothetical protein
MGTFKIQTTKNDGENENDDEGEKDEKNMVMNYL